MTISGLENNYYLAQNDIWLRVDNFAKVPIRLELKVTNLNTGSTMPLFRLYADMNNVFRFNVCQTIRPIQPYPVASDNNTLSEYKLEFKVIFEDNTLEEVALERFFIRGGRDKNNIDEWYLSASYPLIIGKWVEWRGIILPGFAKRIQNNLIVDFIPSKANTYNMILPSACNAKIVRFLNSLGGYQFWVFETSEIQSKAKGQNVISQIPMRLRDDMFRNTGTDSTKQIVLKTKTPAELQPLIIDLISSPEVHLYDPSGNDEDSSWQRLQLSGTNEAVLNTNDMSYNNEIEYNLPSYINRNL